MCENLSTGRLARLAAGAAGKEGVEIWLQDRGTEGFEHSCDKTGEKISRTFCTSIGVGFWVNCRKVRQLGGREG